MSISNEQLFELITKIYNRIESMDNRLTDVDNRLVDVDNRLTNVEKNMATKQDLVKLEYTLTDKINALFDAREVQLDHEDAMATDIKCVKKKVNNIELKLIKNEMN